MNKSRLKDGSKIGMDIKFHLRREKLGETIYPYKYDDLQEDRSGLVEKRSKYHYLKVNCNFCQKQKTQQYKSSKARKLSFFKKRHSKKRL